jgi:glucose/arabinose dehydrogenase
MLLKVVAPIVFAFSVVTASAAPPDALQRMQALLPGAQVKTLTSQQWTVKDRDSAPRKIKPASAFDLNGRVLLEDAADARYYWGSTAENNQLNVDHVYHRFEEFIDANAFAPLPAPPKGFQIRTLAAMPVEVTRLAMHPNGNVLLVLARSGDVYAIDLPHGQPRCILKAAEFASGKSEDFLGITIDKQGRLYLVGNRSDWDATPSMNHVTIYRTPPCGSAMPASPKPWFKTSIPFAVDVFQHGVSHIQQGADGLIYVSSGSRTDHGEAGNDPKRSKDGETPITACIWQLDPRSETPQIHIFARGLRNAFGLCFDNRGRMFATENGPNAHPAEEINFVQADQHYGFPYHFSDWASKAYPDQPNAPAAFEETLPLLNIGPAGGVHDGQPISTLDPHSSPAGIVFLDDTFPAAYRGTMLVARFGNLLALEHDVGFDVVQVRLLDEQNGRQRAEVQPFLAPLGRATDIIQGGKGKLYICEFNRMTHNGGCDWPGRILEVSTTAAASP